MSARGDWALVKAALADALDRAGGERAAHLAALRHRDPALAHEVESLLGWYDRASSLGLREPAPRPVLDPGHCLGPYEIREVVGSGGMATVYRAIDTRLHRPVAVKVMTADQADAAVRFEREVRTVASLAHPGIVSLYDFGRQGDCVFAVTELLDGETLRSRLRRGPLATAAVLDIARQLAAALAAAHERGIVHRDLKPENVFVCKDGTLKILDFGLAKSAGPNDVTSNATVAGMVLGTVGYMAPEQVRGAPVDARADVFAFGILVHELATGRNDFQRESAPETLAAVLRDEARADGVPAELWPVIARCLAKPPACRYASGAELQRALDERVLRGPRGRLRIAASLLILAMAATGGSARSHADGDLRPVDATLAVGRMPASLAGDGRHVWVANRGDGSVTRIGAAEAAVTGTFLVGELPNDVAWAGGSLWIAHHKWLEDSYSLLTRLDPEGRVVARRRLPGQPMYVTVDGANLWITETWPSYTLRRIRVADGADTGSFSAGGVPRQAVTDGTSVWVSNGPIRSLTRMRAADGVVQQAIPVEGDPHQLVRVGDYLWLANNHEDAEKMRILKIRASDLVLLGAVPAPGVLRIAADERWLFTAEPGAVTQRNAADGSAVARYACGPQPSSLLLDDAGLWIADFQDGSVRLVRAARLASP